MINISQYRKQQWAYICVDVLSSLLVWVAFLGFRWMVHEGKVLSVDTILVPIFDSIGVLDNILFVRLLYTPYSKGLCQRVSCHYRFCLGNNDDSILYDYHR